MRTSQKNSQIDRPDSGIAGILLKIIGVTAVGIAGVLMFTSPVRAAETSVRTQYVTTVAAEKIPAGHLVASSR